jgi:hypothetical protein
METSTLVGTIIEGSHPHNKSSMTNLINQLCFLKSQNGLECSKWSFNTICCVAANYHGRMRIYLGIMLVMVDVKFVHLSLITIHGQYSFSLACQFVSIHYCVS